MSRYIEHLIEDARDSSENTDFSTTTGIQDREFIRYLNEGQQRLHNLIVQQHPRVFEQDVEYQISKGQETITLPEDIHVKNMVTMVEYSYNGDEDEYCVLAPTSPRNRQSGIEGVPTHYFVRNNKVFITPTSDNIGGKLRVSYIRRVKKLNRRLASVSNAVLGTNTITSLTVNVISDSVDVETLARANEYFTVVDSQGNIKMNNVRFSEINTSTGEVTIDPSFTFQPGETIDSTDYLVAGRDSSTHIDFNLTDMSERYIEAFCIFKIFKRDSSIDAAEVETELSALEDEIVSAYTEIPNDVIEIPIINNDESWF